ncbi:MAG TPA: ATP-binding protein [Puia sp.]|nr:ATP-binding protein [Puia sp.]
MKKIFFIVSILIVSSGLLNIHAQPLRRYNSSSYNVNEGLLQSHVSDIGFDGAGFMWLSYETGLQRYDGQHFVNIPLQKGLTANQYINFLKSRNRLLWMAHAGGLSAYDAATGKFTLVYKYLSGNEYPAVRLMAEDNGIVFFFCSDGSIVGVNEDNFQVVSRSHFPYAIPNSGGEIYAHLHVSRLSADHTALICFKESVLITWDLQKGLARRIDNLPPSIGISGDGFCQVAPDRYISVESGELKVQDIGQKTSASIFKGSMKLIGADIVTFEPVGENRILISNDDQLFLFNSKTMMLELHLVNSQNQAFSHFAVSAMRVDDFGNIYLLTRSEGIVKLLASSFPISYYGSTQKESNFITCLAVNKKNNRVIAGTLNNGLLVFDTSQKLLQHITHLGNLQYAPQLTIAGIAQVSANNYLLFPRFNSSCVLWNSSSGSLKKVPLASKTKYGSYTRDTAHSIAYYFTRLRLSNGKYLVAVDENLFMVDPLDISTVRIISSPNRRMKGLCIYRNKILVGSNEEILQMRMDDFSLTRAIHIQGCGEIRSLVADSNYIYAGCNQGLFVLNAEGKVVSKFSKADGLPDDYIYALAVDKNQNIWCSTNRGIVRIGKDKEIFHLKKEDGLQENEFNTNVASQEPDGELFFGGVNGINSFYPERIIGSSDSPKIVLTGVRVNGVDLFRDSAVWTVAKINLPYTSNNLYFEFTALGTKNPDQYQYQYRIATIDRNWIQSGSVQNARYVLSPGNYTFEVCAGSVYSTDPKNIRSIEIFIKPPFWRSWWFIVAAAVGFGAIIALFFWQYNRNKYRTRIRQFQLQHEIQTERERISRDLHDNLGAYAAAIAANVSKVQAGEEIARNEGVSALRHNSQSIVTQLNDTIWALNREFITLTSISDRFKVFLQKIQPSYGAIHIHIQENIENDALLSPVHALHLFRMMQEGVNNALRHSECSNIWITLTSQSAWYVSITDDGKGLRETNGSLEGNGLKNMKQRAAESGWRIEWRNIAPRGTRLDILSSPTIN